MFDCIGRQVFGILLKQLPWTIILPIMVVLFGTQSFAANSEDYQDPLTIQEPLTPAFEARFKPFRKLIKSVYVEQGADAHVFDNPKLFPNLEKAALSINESINKQLLHALAVNYPNLEIIALGQKEPLSKDSLKLLGRFKRLETLGLDCDLVDGSAFKESIPPSVVYMMLNNKASTTWSFPSLPNLELLRLGAPVDTELLKNLDAPKLRELNIEASISHEAVAEIARFRHLDCLFIKEKISREDFEFLKRLGIREVICPHD